MVATLRCRVMSSGRNSVHPRNRGPERPLPIVRLDGNRSPRPWTSRTIPAPEFRVFLLLLLYLGPFLVGILLEISGMFPRRGGFFRIVPLLFLIPELLDVSQFGSWFLNMGILAALCLVLLLLSPGLLHLVRNRERRSRTPAKRSTGNRKVPSPVGDGINPHHAFRHRHNPVRFHRILTGLPLLCSIAACPTSSKEKSMNSWSSAIFPD